MGKIVGNLTQSFTTHFWGVILASNIMIGTGGLFATQTLQNESSTDNFIIAKTTLTYQHGHLLMIKAEKSHQKRVQSDIPSLRRFQSPITWNLGVVGFLFSLFQCFSLDSFGLFHFIVVSTESVE